MSHFSIYGAKFLKYVAPRFFTTFIIWLLLFGTINKISLLIGSVDIGILLVSVRVVFLLINIFVIVFIWSTYSVLANLASSLGYNNRNVKEFQIVGNTGVINIPSFDDHKQEFSATRIDYVSEKYEKGNPLLPLSQSRSRIYGHIGRLQNSSIVNLFIGIAIAFTGILILGSTFFEIEKYADKTQGFNTAGFLIFALLPRLSIALIVQIFSFFFLLMYRSNVNDVRYFQNEITNIDAVASAISCLRNENDVNIKAIISVLLKTERNRLVPKGQKLISPSTDEDIIERLSRIEVGLNKQILSGKNMAGTDA